MSIVRFIIPFLFVRNWYNGAWELSQQRCVLFGLMILIIIVGFGIAYVLQTPITYTAP